MSSDLLKYDLERDDLCQRLGGGIPAGTLMVIEGPDGAGKSILTQRMTAGLIRHDHTVSYVSTELTTKSFFQQMESLDYPVRKSILSEQLVFVPTHPILGARAPKGELLERIAKARHLYSRDVIIFDAFSKFINDYLAANGDDYDVRERVEGILHLFKRVTHAGRTIILTLEEGQIPKSFSGPFCEAADTYIKLENEVTGGSAARRIIVKRMSRAAGRFGEVIGYRVEPGIGLVVEIRSVV